MLIDKIKLHNPINLRSNFNKKIAVLFRGPIRPNAEAVAANTSGLIEELRFAGYNVTPYLATWSNYNRAEVMKLLSMGLYDNIIMQQLPTREHIRRCVNRDSYGIYPIVNVYGMYYQSKTAIDLIASANNYNYIVHSRTDLHVRFGKHLHEWFDNDKYVSPINETPWICDWIGIATPEIMQNAWNYIDYGQLGRLIDNTDVPEYILSMIMKHHNVTVKTNDVEEIWLDPNRNG